MAELYRIDIVYSRRVHSIKHALHEFQHQYGSYLGIKLKNDDAPGKLLNRYIYVLVVYTVERRRGENTWRK